MAITNAQQARQLYNEGGPMRKIKGQDHMLAYITPNEADKLVKLGGQETMTPEGILAYPEFDNYSGPNTPGGAMSRSDFEGGAYSGTGSSNDGVIQQYNTPQAPPKKPKKTKENFRESNRFITPTLAVAKFVGEGIKNSKLGRFLNTKARENYLENLKEDDPDLYQDTVGDLAKLGYAERDVELYGPKGKREGPMAPGRDIETFTDLYEDQAKSILNTVRDNKDGSVGTLYDDYLDEKMNRFTPDNDGGDPCKGPNPPAYCFVGIRSAEAATPEVEEEDEGLFRRFRADGGIMNSDVVGGEMDFKSARQMYGLGKLVKKITRSVKKVAKSPIGKAAIGYALTGGLSNLAAGQSFGTNFFSPTSFISKGGIKNIFTKQGLGNIGSSFGLGSMVSQKTAGDSVIKQFVPNMLGKIATSPAGLIAGTSLIAGALTAEQEEEAQLISDETGIDIAEIRANPNKYLARRFRAEGGSMDEPVAKKTMPLLDMDGKEMDLRAEGGFVPIGRMEKADDVPARLSKNEFVFTADAVRNAGEGDVDKGAEVMYNMMKNLESGGDVSEESQGLEGAREMFQTSQRLEEVI